MTGGGPVGVQSFGWSSKMSESYCSGKGSVYSIGGSGGGSYRFAGENFSAGGSQQQQQQQQQQLQQQGGCTCPGGGGPGGNGVWEGGANNFGPQGFA
jgi:hypothetical protein